jgi:hypothetical protein
MTSARRTAGHATVSGMDGAREGDGGPSQADEGRHGLHVRKAEDDGDEDGSVTHGGVGSCSPQAISRPKAREARGKEERRVSSERSGWEGQLG